MLPNWCCLCRDDVESVDHLFLHCPWSRQFWDYFVRCMGIYCAHPASMRVLLLCWPKQSLGENRIRSSEVWLMVSAANWEEHNRRIFYGVWKNSRDILDNIIAEIHSWLFFYAIKEDTSA